MFEENEAPANAKRVDPVETAHGADSCDSCFSEPAVSPTSGSVTQWIHDVRAYCDQDASRALFDRYSAKLVQMLRSRVNQKTQSVEKADDVAAFALSEALSKLQNGNLPDVSDRSGLWSLMVSIADYRTRHVAHHESRAKRNRNRTLYVDQLQGDCCDSDALPFQFSSREPTPEITAAINEQMEYLYNRLSSDEYRALLEWELAGYSAIEMQEKLSCVLGYFVSERTLRRKRARMRKELQSAYGGSSEDNA